MIPFDELGISYEHASGNWWEYLLLEATLLCCCSKTGGLKGPISLHVDFLKIFWAMDHGRANKNA